MDFFDKINSKKNEWAFLHLSQEDQEAWVKKELVSRITSTFLNDDRVVEITLLEEAYDIVKNTILNSGPDEEILTAAKVRLESQVDLDLDAVRYAYSEHLQHINFTRETAVNIVPGSINIDSLTPEVLFIQMKTASGMEKQELTEWASAIGLKEVLENSYVNFGISELRVAYLMFQLLSLGTKKSIVERV